MRSEVPRGIKAGVRRKADTVRGGVTGNTLPVTQRIAVKGSPQIWELGVEKQEEWIEIEQRRRQHVYCSQIEDNLEERDVMDWYEDGEMRKQWECLWRLCKKYLS